MNIIIYTVVILTLFYLLLRFITNISSKKLSKGLRILIVIGLIVLAILFAIAGRYILTLPLTASKYLVLILSFITGLVIDMFSSTMGFHVAATVFVGFLRPYILKLLEPRDGYEPNYSVNVSDMGLKWFATYTVILVLAHHLFLFYVESFTLSQFFTTLGRALLSTIFTLFLITITQLLYYKQNNKR